MVDYLYIDADEDHVSLQFKEKKGDLVMGENHQINNCVLAKLVYVYEGIEKESPRSKRNKLVTPHISAGSMTGKRTRNYGEKCMSIWTKYDLEKVKKIYLNADGVAGSRQERSR